MNEKENEKLKRTAVHIDQPGSVSLSLVCVLTPALLQCIKQLVWLRLSVGVEAATVPAAATPTATATAAVACVMCASIPNPEYT